ncbi:MAG TPA: chromosomal replication initiator protein DnaA [Patescibacteria group bacterium]|nr:chromosomal replication initiator protein DnaA [Patescibacteria group bacterium]
MDLQALWQSALGELELTLSKANFTTWFKNTFIGSFENGKIIVSVPNTFTKAWLEKKYHEAIVKALRNVTNQGVREVNYRVEVKNTTVLPLESALAETSVEYASQPAQACPSTECPGTDIGLNPRYNFKNFIVGKSNELAHAACQAVAAKPGEVYNPLFLYGGAGMGKTHLLQAIGHHILSTNPQAKLRYVTCEAFTNEFIQSVRSGHINEFKDGYRNVDILLIDDIQFLTGKEGTQEEFFHTFNTLHQNNKQIVITSDRPPKDIQALESRLLSRFEWGMMADISKPDFETRVAIIQAKTREKNYPLTTEILHLIAGSIQSNIRELEGALNKIVAYHQFKNIQPTLATVQPLLQSFVPTVSKHNITPRHLLEVVVSFYDIPFDALMGKSRERRFAFPRQIAMYLLREETRCSFPAIGENIGGRDHTTAMHACSKIGEMIKKDDQLKRDLTTIRERLYSNAGAAA